DLLALRDRDLLDRLDGDEGLLHRIRLALRSLLQQLRVTSLPTRQGTLRRNIVGRLGSTEGSTERATQNEATGRRAEDPLPLLLQPLPFTTRREFCRDRGGLLNELRTGLSAGGDKTPLKDTAERGSGGFRHSAEAAPKDGRDTDRLCRSDRRAPRYGLEGRDGAAEATRLRLVIRGADGSRDVDCWTERAKHHRGGHLRERWEG